MTIKQRKWRWLGQMLRKGQDDSTNQALTWNPLTGKRKPGRPKTTRRREFMNEQENENLSSFSDASTEAKSKEKWRNIVRVLCSEKKR